jgi:hypothetical protein
MNAGSDLAQPSRKLHVQVVKVIEQKGQGYTIIVRVAPVEEITSEENWRIALPGDFRGATRVNDLWHLYYGKDPGYKSGDSMEIELPERAEGETH